MNKFYITLLFCFILSGCALAPGMRASFIGKKHPTSQLNFSTSSRIPKTSVVTITPITPATIMRLLREEQQRIPVFKMPPSQPQGSYRVGAHDVLGIIVWDHPELNNPFINKAYEIVVGADGNIFYPYIGSVKVAGLTIPEIRELLTQSLATYIQDPQLEVEIVKYKSQKVYVVGAVKIPGIHNITNEPLTVVDAINKAGGVIMNSGGSSNGGSTEEADMENVTLNRNQTIYKINLLAIYEQGDMQQNIILQDGDILSVPDSSANKVFILGEVRSPRSQFIHKGRLTLAESLSDAGGVNQLSADPSLIYVIRHGAKKPEIFHFNGKSPDALVLADRFPLRPRDVVYVGTASITNWNRVISQIVPISSLLYQTTLLNNSLNQ